MRAEVRRREVSVFRARHLGREYIPFVRLLMIGTNPPVVTPAVVPPAVQAQRVGRRLQYDKSSGPKPTKSGLGSSSNCTAAISSRPSRAAFATRCLPSMTAPLADRMIG